MCIKIKPKCKDNLNLAIKYLLKPLEKKVNINNKKFNNNQKQIDLILFKEVQIIKIHWKEVFLKTFNNKILFNNKIEIIIKIKAIKKSNKIYNNNMNLKSI